ncbi:hypothetical protein [Loigolactobacillus backii]|uniref:hypothetical protein n=1 Tax=Loigolactobacillus backii TaxID=375175 RepID=UPI0007F0BAC4|nr:hypothetical protein [Loigolactobacillus backii]ANK59806.1 hypothetical protein AYR52_05755 [Loigolactobacillus backii]
MANEYNITKGTQNWNVNANNFMNEYFGSDSGYQTTGITYTNGATADDPVSYQTLSSASGIGLIVFGGISIPNTLIDSGYDPVPIIKFPANANVKAFGLQWYAPCSGGIARLMLNESMNAILIYPSYFIYNHGKPTGNLFVNVSQIFSTHR